MTAPHRDPEVVHRAFDIFRAVCDLEPASQQQGIDDACGSDPVLRAAVESLLHADGLSGDALSENAAFCACEGDVPAEIDGFRIVREIGRGGMGVVYEAAQSSPERRVALKLMLGGINFGSIRARVRREAAVLARLRHPGIAQIFQAGEYQGRPYLTMELVEGSELRAAAKALDLPGRLALLARIAEAIHHAHLKGVIHRDLKPENILVVENHPGAEPLPKVLDFGIARVSDENGETLLTQTIAEEGSGSLLGTLAYMAPEQVEGTRDVDVRTDVYGLGMIAYELLTGHPAINTRGKSVVAAMQTVVQHTPPHLGTVQRGLRGDVATVVHKAIQKEPEQRYQSAAEFAADIRHCLAREPISARPPSLGYLTGRLMARHRISVAGIAFGLFAILAGFGFALNAAMSEHAIRIQAESMLYSNALDGAEQALLQYDTSRAKQLLSDAPEHLRGWEWDVINNRVASGRSLTTGDLPEVRNMIFNRTSDFKKVWFYGPAQGESLKIQQFDGRQFGPIVQIEHALFANNPKSLFALEDGRLLTVDSEQEEALLLDPSTQGIERIALAAPDGETNPFDGTHDHVPCRMIGDAVVVKQRNHWRINPTIHHPVLGPIFHTVFGNSEFNSGLQIQIRHAASGRLIHEFTTPRQINSVITTDNASRLFVSDYRGWIYGFDIQSGEELSWSPARFDTYAIQSLAVSSKNNSLALGFNTGRLAVIDIQSGQLTRSFNSPGSPFAHVQFEAGDTRLLAITNKGEAIHFNLETKQDILRGHDAAVNPIRLSLDGDRIVSGAWDGSVRIWDTTTGDLMHTISPPEYFQGTGTIRQIAIHPNGHEGVALLSTRFGNRTRIFRFEIQTGRVIKSYENTLQSWSSRIDFKFDQSGVLHIMTEELAEVPENASLHITPMRGWTALRDCARDSETWVQLSDDPSFVTLMALGSNEPIFQSSVQRINQIVVGLSPSKDTIALAANSNEMQLLNMATGEQLGTLAGHTGTLLGVAWSPDGQRIATTSRDGTVGIWDAGSYRLLARFFGHNDYVYDAAWSPDSQTLFTSSGDGTIRAWRSTSSTAQ